MTKWVALKPELKQRHQSTPGTKVQDAGLQRNIGEPVSGLPAPSDGGYKEMRVRRKDCVWGGRVSVENTAVSTSSAYSLKLRSRCIRGVPGKPEMNVSAVRDAGVSDLTPALKISRERGRF